MIPSLYTDRLVLRGHTLNDFPGCAELWDSEDVTRFITGKPLSRGEVWSRMCRYLGHWNLLGYGYFAIAERNTNTFVGEMGVADYARSGGALPGSAPETGWALRPEYQHRGYANEALAALLDWGDRQPALSRTICTIDPRNHPSLKLAMTAGYREYSRSRTGDVQSINLERYRT